MSSNLQSNPYQSPDIAYDYQRRHSVVTQTKTGLRTLIVGITAFAIQSVLNAYFVLFAFPWILFELESNNSEASRNLVTLSDFSTLLYDNWRFLVGLLILTLIIQELFMPKKFRPVMRHKLGLILILFSLPAAIWTLATILFAPY